MYSFSDSEGEFSFWLCGDTHNHHSRVALFAEQFYSPDYIETYPWEIFDPSYATKLDLSFAALSPAEQFLRLPKGVVENKKHMRLNKHAVAKVLTWLGDHGKAQNEEYLEAVENKQCRAWGIVKRFNGALKRRREKLERVLGEEEVKRLRRLMKEERRKMKRERRKMKREAMEYEENTRRKRRKINEEEEEEEEEEAGNQGESLSRESVRRILEDMADVHFGEKWVRFQGEDATTIQTRIWEFESKREDGNHDKTYLKDLMMDVVERIEGFMYKTRRGIDGMWFSREYEWMTHEPEVTDIMGVLECVYLPVKRKVKTESGEEQWKVTEVSDELRTYGVKKRLGDLLFRFLFESGIELEKLVRWFKSKEDLYQKLGMLLQSMTRAGMDRTVMQEIAGPFDIEL
ncbi:hypothetical protein QBC45DRAFT_438083 [Copromyces sp. CBS 386.78]|nr:hypothetical protein QBC45DRAFT_438083 [Copromyces sp. CBS 386.78]